MDEIKNELSTKKPVKINMSKDRDNIAEHFIQFLQPQLATTQSLREEVFKIRHDVYCQELSFEKEKKDGLETDEFDSRSTFSLIQHQASKKFISCVRLVTSKNAGELLPIEKYCSDSITKQELRPSNFDRKEIGEISRLAIKLDFRRRKGDNFKGCATGVISESIYSDTELRCFPFIAIGLYMSAAIMCQRQGIKHTYVMMDPKLARSLKFVGINFQQLGPAVNYHGLRAPYYITHENFIQHLSPDFKKLYYTIEKSICTPVPHFD